MRRYGLLLEIKEIVKRRGEESVLCGLSLDFKEKGIYGVLGAEGAGKTTLAEIICGCRDKDDGEITVDGEKMSRSAYKLKTRVRLVPTDLVADGSMTPVEYLDFVGDSLGVESDKKYRQIKEAIELVGLEEQQNKTLSAIGAAARCKLAIAASLIGNPEIIIVDEPFSAVESTAMTEMYDLLKMLGKIKTVVLFSHKPSEVKTVCDSVAIMSGGKIALCGKISDIEAKINSTHELHISVRGNAEDIIKAIKDTENVINAKVTSTDKNNVNAISVEHYPDPKMKDKLFASLSAINAPMLSVKAITLTLDDVFYSLTATDARKNRERQEKIAADANETKKFGRRRSK